MKDKADKIVQQLKQYKNGIVADNMAEKLLAYDINYGVPVVNIMEMAKKYYPDNVLAMQLIERPEREAKLAAIYIINPTELTLGQIDILENHVVNNEIAEQISMRVISKSPHALEYALKWCRQCNNEFIQKAGWMVIGRIAENITANEMPAVFKLIDYADFSSVHVRAALTFTLPKLAATSAEFKKMVQNWADKNIQSKNSNIQQVSSEVNAFLNI